ncbi:MAG: hypothetical protein J5927_00095 [Oscillospiraceae bacterium]|nr:hypothetical protein [Oscillospiraceae bacterium]
MEELFLRYGAIPTGLAPRNRLQFGDRTIYERAGSYYRAGTAKFDGQDFLVISCIDKQKFAAVGILEDIDVLPADCGEERLERAVRYALGVEPYPEIYPEQ